MTSCAAGVLVMGWCRQERPDSPQEGLVHSRATRTLLWQNWLQNERRDETFSVSCSCCFTVNCEYCTVYRNKRATALGFGGDEHVSATVNFQNVMLDRCLCNRLFVILRVLINDGVNIQFMGNQSSVVLLSRAEFDSTLLLYVLFFRLH